jgi:HD-GYP domain-containing protein (c-di-GMP phosphodiesterase class II)
LGEDDIPLGARILHVAEAYDTMTSDRAYHRARSPAAAVEELRQANGLQFDPRVVEAFLDIQGDSDSEKEAQRERITRTFTARRVQRGVMNVLNSDLENLDDAPSKPAEPDKPETSDESARDRNG